MDVLILTEKELRSVIQVDQDAISAVASGFEMLSRGDVSMPPVMHIEVSEYDGDVDIKSAYVKGLERFAVKIGAGFFQNYKLGLPSSPAMMVVISARTGMAEAVLLDNAYLTDVRTAAAGAVAAKYLAPEKVQCAGIIGAGVQGRFQMQALKQVRDFSKVMVYDLDPALVEQYVKEMTPILQAEVIPAVSVKEVLEKSQSVVTCTPAREPYILPEFLHPGLHITAMGADLPEKQEIVSAVFEQVDIITCDRKSQSFNIGELFNATNDGIKIDPEDVFEIGSIVAGNGKKRASEDQITICDLSGTGVQDTVIADLALKKAKNSRLGQMISMQ